jgi:D-alanyl-D-alanine carboxypeptidase (penicillin-binding protein 5/6)
MRLFHRITFLFVVVLVLSTGVSCAEDYLDLTAKSVLVYDITTDRVLYAKNPKVKLPAASTIKLMTALITIDNYQIVKKCKATSRAFNFPYKKYLKKGSEYTTDDLLRALLLASSNDAANVLAEGVAGSMDDFVAQMNDKASALGAIDTIFANPSGLTDKKVPQCTTAYDLCRIMKRFLRYPRLYGMISEHSNVIKGSDGSWVFLQNHNRLMRRYPKTVVGKTGYTNLARHCFVGFSTVPRKRYIFVILGAERPWQDMSKLLHYTGCIDRIVER